MCLQRLNAEGGGKRYPMADIGQSDVHGTPLRLRQVAISELSRFKDLDAAVTRSFEQRFVAAADDVGSRGQCAGDEHVVVRIGADLPRQRFGFDQGGMRFKQGYPRGDVDTFELFG